MSHGGPPSETAHSFVDSEAVESEEGEGGCAVMQQTSDACVGSANANDERARRETVGTRESARQEQPATVSQPVRAPPTLKSKLLAHQSDRSFLGGRLCTSERIRTVTGARIGYVRQRKSKPN